MTVKLPIMGTGYHKLLKNLEIHQNKDLIFNHYDINLTLRY